VPAAVLGITAVGTSILALAGAALIIISAIIHLRL
jgi:hypothetical protein